MKIYLTVIALSTALSMPSAAYASTHESYKDSPFIASTISHNAPNTAPNTPKMKALIDENNKQLERFHLSDIGFSQKEDEQSTYATHIKTRQAMIPEEFENGEIDLAVVLEEYPGAGYSSMVCGSYYKYDTDTGNIYIRGTWFDQDQLESNERLFSAANCLLGHFQSQGLFQGVKSLLISMHKGSKQTRLLEYLGFEKDTSGTVHPAFKHNDSFDYDAYIDIFTKPINVVRTA